VAAPPKRATKADLQRHIADLQAQIQAQEAHRPHKRPRARDDSDAESDSTSESTSSIDEKASKAEQMQMEHIGSKAKGFTLSAFTAEKWTSWAMSLPHEVTETLKQRIIFVLSDPALSKYVKYFAGIGVAKPPTIKNLPEPYMAETKTMMAEMTALVKASEAMGDGVYPIWYHILAASPASAAIMKPLQMLSKASTTDLPPPPWETRRLQKEAREAATATTGQQAQGTGQPTTQPPQRPNIVHRGPRPFGATSDSRRNFPQGPARWCTHCNRGGHTYEDCRTRLGRWPQQPPAPPAQNAPEPQQPRA
jgi:hypothetical protein